MAHRYTSFGDFWPFYLITKSALTLAAKVPGIDADEFARLAEEAERNCPVSKLLDCEITLEHSLES